MKAIFYSMRHIFLMICTLLAFLSNIKGQDVYPVKTGLFNWKKYEQINLKQVNAFIAEQPNYFRHFKLRNEYNSLTIEDLVKSIHFIDLDKDGINEVVFDGQSEGEGNETIIFQKINSQYQRVFTGRQSIVDIQWQSNGETKIYLSDFGCCAEYTHTQKIFKLTKTETNKIKLSKIYQSIVFSEGKLPDSLFPKPIRFKVGIDNYKLRHSPRFDDSSYQPWDYDTSKPVGNVIAKLSKGTQGYGMGFKTDKSGRQWWYVEIDAQSILYHVQLFLPLEFPTKIIGWVSSTYLEKE